MSDQEPAERPATDTEARLREALGTALPPDLRAGLAALAALIDSRAAGGDPGAGPAIAELLRRLAGRQIPAGSSVIAIGDGSQLGDITISDVAGGDVVKLSVIGSQYVAAPSPQEALAAEEARLRAQERVRREAERHDADMALLRKLSVAIYQLRASLHELRALGAFVAAEDLAGYQRAFDEARALMYESRAFLERDFSAITHDLLAIHTSLAGGIKIMLRQRELGLDAADLMD